MNRFVGWASLSVLCMPLVLPAHAADMALEEIIVTAQKRAQDVQDVPLAVTAFDGAALETHGAVNLTDLNGIAPNVVLQQQGLIPNVGQMAIRGISFADPDPNADAKTGLIVDGAVRTRNSGVLMDSFDVARVEILRGPQGTLFGRNNLAGTVSMVTERPTEEFGGKVRATYGDYGQRILRGAINSGSFADGALRARLSGTTRTYDGYQRNIYSGNKLSDTDSSGGRLTLEWDHGDWDAALITDYEEEHVNGPANLNAVVIPAGFGGDVYHVAQDVDGFSDFETWGSTLEANRTIDAGTFTLVANYREQEYTTFGDFDGRVGLTPPPAMNFHIGRDMEQHQQSAEIRFANSANSRSDLFNYVVGVFYIREQYEQDNLRSTTLSIANSALLSVNGQTADSYAVFGQTDINLTDRFALVLGARATSDTKDFKIDTSFGGVPISIRSNSDWSEATWKAGANYFFADDIMAYGNVSTGYKGGGYNSRATVPRNVGPYDPETLTNYEVGLKGDFVDKRIRVNAATFYSDYSDLQGSVRRPGANPTGTESITQNLGDAEIWGVELETVFLVTEKLTVTANLAHLDAEWSTFLVDLTNSGVVTDNSFLDLPNAPEWSGYVGADYDQPVGGAGGLTFHADARYTSEYNTLGTSNAAVYDRREVTLVNAYITFTPTDDRYSVSIYGKNLTDEEVISGSTFVLFPLLYYQPPREYGVEAQWNF